MPVSTVEELQVFRTGHLGRRILCQWYQRDLQPRHLFHHNTAQIGKRRPVGLRDVDRMPGVFRRRDLLGKVRHAEIELVVAGHSHVEGDEVGQVDRVLPLVETRQDRGRQHVTIEKIERVGIGRAFRLGDGVQAGETSLILLAGEIVDVADPEDGQLHFFCEGGLRQKRKAQDCNGELKPGRVHGGSPS